MINNREEFTIKAERFEKGFRFELICDGWICASVVGPDESTATHMFGSLIVQVLKGDPPRPMTARARLEVIQTFANSILGIPIE